MKRFIKLFFGMMMIGLVVFSTTKMTIAWLSAETIEIQNKFSTGIVESEIIEEFDGQTKTDVSIKNTGNIDAYIRVALIPAWKEADGNVSGTPVGAEYTKPQAPDGWFLKDGFYYHMTKVPSGENTSILISEFTMPTKDGLLFELQILASAIQANPKEAVEDSWPVIVDTAGKLNGGGP
ncbi:MAG: hypothetical protein WBI17_12070 [Clostridiaceae bacterium]